MIPVYEALRVKVIQTENRMVVTEGLGREWGVGVEWGWRVSLGGLQSSGDRWWGWLQNTVNVLKATELHTYKWLE